jgi:hypothetical protein
VLLCVSAETKNQKTTIVGQFRVQGSGSRVQGLLCEEALSFLLVRALAPRPILLLFFALTLTSLDRLVLFRCSLGAD